MLLLLATLFCAPKAGAVDIFIRFKVLEPKGDHLRVTVGGFRHRDPWNFPEMKAEVKGGTWSAWQDLSKWPWHGRLDREGGKAEWPSIKLTLAQPDNLGPVRGCALMVQLADRPDEGGVVLSFQETSKSNAIAFLVPNPLREHASEFETGSQMTARHHAWAMQATGGKPVALKKFRIITALWGHYDPGLARVDLETLGMLGFNVVSGTDVDVIRAAGMTTYGGGFMYDVDPEAIEKQWKASSAGLIARELRTEEGAWRLRTMSHWVISDEVSTVDFRQVEAGKRDAWFRSWLREKGVTEAELGTPIEQVAYPAEAMNAKTLPRDAPLATRRLLYYAAKFGQWWSARQLRFCGDLVKSSLPGMRTETLPTDHGFFNAWGPPHIGMSYRLLDLFELGAQRSVDQLSAEDWLGLNHMYGPATTWTGAQSFGYLNAIMRSAIADRPILQRGLITPSDDRYLRLKAYSALGQGAKSFFFWTYGPTYIGTENYWSDLQSEYGGIARLTRALAKSEDVLYPAKPVRDPVAILYSVSHDYWHSDDPAAFVEKRLLWHGLRHAGIQPDFLREEDLEQGRLRGYRALYVTDWCISRKASAAIDAWVRAGGVVYLSAGAATRDEFYEPYVPPFAARVWPMDAAAGLVAERHTYNERTDLPGIAPMTHVNVRLGEKRFTLPVLGCRLNLRKDTTPAAASSGLTAVFDDGQKAANSVKYGEGRIIAVGFMPMLSYGQLAGFKPTEMAERWPDAPRKLIELPLTLAHIHPAVRVSVPVVEVSLLNGPMGSALVLANYTYHPIRSLSIDIAVPGGMGRAVSTEGARIRQTKTKSGVRLELPLDNTDIVILPNGK